jgi:hypothetical protein
MQSSAKSAEILVSRFESSSWVHRWLQPFPGGGSKIHTFSSQQKGSINGPGLSATEWMSELHGDALPVSQDAGYDKRCAGTPAKDTDTLPAFRLSHLKGRDHFF